MQNNVPVGHIMISMYCWHSNVNKSFEIKICSEQNVNSLKTIYFKGKSLMYPHYAEAVFKKTILLLFSHMNFIHKKNKKSRMLSSTMKFFTTIEMFTRKMAYLQKKNSMEKLSWFFQIVALNIRVEFVFLDILTKP